jgi:hypothetical protein
MATVTLARIHGVEADMATALNRTSDHCMLPQIEQARILGNSCAEACSLLGDWLRSSWWDKMRPSRGSRNPIAEFVPSRQHFEHFLGPTLQDAYIRAAGQCGMTVSASDVDAARDAVQATARRYPYMSRRELYEVANIRVESLMQQVCELSVQLHNQIRIDENRRKARAGGRRVAGLMTAFVLAIAGYSPNTARANLSEWGKAAIEVITVYHIAESALPEEPVAPLQIRWIP